MKKIQYIGLMTLALFFSFKSHAQSSMELEEACLMDVGLTEYIVEVIENGSSSAPNVVSDEELAQIRSVLSKDENQSLLMVSEKLNAVLMACSEGRIFQQRHSKIIRRIN